MSKKFKKTDFLRGRKIQKESKPEENQVQDKPEQPKEVKVETAIESHESKPSQPKISKKPTNIKEFYELKYKTLLIIPIIILIASLLQIGYQVSSTGSFVNKGISLSGGISVTIYKEMDVDIINLETKLLELYPNNDIAIRKLSQSGSLLGIIVEADIDGTQGDMVDMFLENIKNNLPESISKDDYTVEVMGSSLGASFFKETFKALYVAFLFMGMVVFYYFGENVKIKIYSTFITLFAAFSAFSSSSMMNTLGYLLGAGLLYIYIKNSIPSVAVILAAFSDIIITLAVFNLLGLKLSTAGIAGFLMLIGYSVDTDILLSTKVLKRKSGSLMERIYDAMKTGLMMNLSTLVALSVALFFAESETIKQIMTILIIGLLADLVNTWIQNVGLLRLYLEKKKND